MAPELENGLLHSSLRRQPSSWKEEEEVKNVNWWQPPLPEPSQAQEARLRGGCRLFCARPTPTAIQRLALAGVASEFSSLPKCLAGVTVQDAVTHVLGQEPVYDDDKATRKPALLARLGFVAARTRWIGPLEFLW